MKVTITPEDQGALRKEMEPAKRGRRPKGKKEKDDKDGCLQRKKSRRLKAYSKKRSGSVHDGDKANAKEMPETKTVKPDRKKSKGKLAEAADGETHVEPKKRRSPKSTAEDKAKPKRGRQPRAVAVAPTDGKTYGCSRCRGAALGCKTCKRPGFKPRGPRKPNPADVN